MWAKKSAAKHNNRFLASTPTVLQSMSRTATEQRVCADMSSSSTNLANYVDHASDTTVASNSHRTAPKSKPGPSGKLVLWEQYKQLVPNGCDRRLTWRTAKTSDIILELRRLREHSSAPLPASSTSVSPQNAASSLSQSASSEQCSRVVRKRSRATLDHEAPPNYFALSLPATPEKVDSLVNDLVARERHQYGDSQVVQHPNDPVVQRHYFNNVRSQQDILDAVDSVFQQQNRVCKMNVRFGLILEKEGQFQLMDATKTETTMFHSTGTMPTIQNADDLQRHIKADIDGDKLRDTFDYPDSDSQICGVWQVMVETFGMAFPMGAGSDFIDDMADDEDEDEDLASFSDELDEDASDMDGFVADDDSDLGGDDIGAYLRISALMRDEDAHIDEVLGSRSPNADESPNALRRSRFVKTPDIPQVNLCFWACLSMHQGKHRKRCFRAAKNLFRRYYGSSRSVTEYPGVQLSELLDIEKVFKINILLYTDENEPRLIFRGGYKFTSEHNICLLVTGGDVDRDDNSPLHVALVTQPDRFFKRVTCTSCGKIFPTQKQMQRHLQANSCNEDRDVFVPKASVYTPRENSVKVFVQKWNKPKQIQNDPFTKYYASFDYESMLLRVPQTSDSIDGKLPEDDTKSCDVEPSEPSPKRSRIDPNSGGPSTRFLSEHVPVSVSIQSNVPGFEGPKFIYNEDPYKLNQSFYEYLTEMAEHAKELERERFRVDDTICEGAQARDFDKMFIFPVLGFNSGKYDLMLGQNSGLFHYFDDGGIKHPIKRGTRYLQMRLEKSGITFLDILNYMPPGTNLDSYIRGFGIKHGKFVFPYEWFDAYEKLKATEFPPIDAFYSSLRGDTIEQTLYDDAKAYFTAECATMMDFLRHYNNRDVGPFLEAITAHFQFFKDQGLDMFQDGMTVSSLAEKLMFQFAHKYEVTRDELVTLAPGEAFDIDDATLKHRIESYLEQDRRRKERKAQRDALMSGTAPQNDDDEDDDADDDVEAKHDAHGNNECDHVPQESIACMHQHSEGEDLLDNGYVSPSPDTNVVDDLLRFSSNLEDYKDVGSDDEDLCVASEESASYSSPYSIVDDLLDSGYVSPSPDIDVFDPLFHSSSSVEDCGDNERGADAIWDECAQLLQSHMPLFGAFSNESDVDPEANSEEMVDGVNNMDDDPPEVYVTPDDITSVLRWQRFRCEYCWDVLTADTWSVDRKNNFRDHLRGNFVISCLRCNKSKRNRWHEWYLKKRRLDRLNHILPQIHTIDVPDIYHKLRDNMVGGPSIVFHRYHEVDQTYIKEIRYDDVRQEFDIIDHREEVVQKILGYDAASLYLYCLGQVMPGGRLEFDMRDRPLDVILEEVESGEMFGFLEVDIHVPEHLKSRFAEMPPIFKNIEIPWEEIGPFMQQLFQPPGPLNREDPRPPYPKGEARRRLIGSFFGTKILLYTPLLQWYLRQGLVVTTCHSIIQATPVQPFIDFRSEVIRQRTMADADPDFAIRGLMFKIAGNGSIGTSMMDKRKHSKTIITSDIKRVMEYHNHRKFKSTSRYDLRESPDGPTRVVYEVSRGKTSFKHDRPLQLGLAVYYLAKLHMLQFYYDFLLEYIPRECWSMIQMDTDSLYLALSKGSLREAVPAHRLVEFDEAAKVWLSNNGGGKKDRTPGKFKIEQEAARGIALSSKCYFTDDGDAKLCDACARGNSRLCEQCAPTAHYSCKGVSKRTNNLNFKVYQHALHSHRAVMAVNRGIRQTPENVLVTYEQTKRGISPLYYKRRVADDGVTTLPLNI